jgi:hypothetical protein
MNGLIIFLGESFRLGCQGTRNRGHPESYNEQINACNSHIHFIENTITKYNMNSMSVFISSYTTQFETQLLSIYNKHLIGSHFYSDMIGLTNLFQDSIKKIENIANYDFIFYIRIDLFLKPLFIDLFNPYTNIILYPTICWILLNYCSNHPRVNDMMLFIPKKYYKYLQNITICHEIWYNLMHSTDLTYDDMDTLIHTYHDSDSCKDYNPLYYIVNRPENSTFHSDGYIFDKYNFSGHIV